MKENKKEEQEIRELVWQMHHIEYGAAPEEKVLKGYGLSNDFYRNISLMVKEYEKRERRCRERYVLAAAALFCFIVWNFYHPQYVKALHQKYFKWYENHVQFQGKDILEQDYPDMPQLELTYLPEGDKVVEEYYSQFLGLVHTENDLWFTYSYSDSVNEINNEGGNFYVKQADGIEVFCFKAYDKTRSSYIIWYSEDGKIIYMIDGYASMEELFRIKNGIKIKK